MTSSNRKIALQTFFGLFVFLKPHLFELLLTMSEGKLNVLLGKCVNREMSWLASVTLINRGIIVGMDYSQLPWLSLTWTHDLLIIRWNSRQLCHLQSTKRPLWMEVWWPCHKMPSVPGLPKGLYIYYIILYYKFRVVTVTLFAWRSITALSHWLFIIRSADELGKQTEGWILNTHILLDVFRLDCLIGGVGWVKGPKGQADREREKCLIICSGQIHCVFQ